jgi:Zn-dependent M28 family amino/carboxypeptidase
MYKILAVTFFTFISNVIIVAQTKTVDPSKYGKTITVADLKKHLYYIAGPETEGRGTGTPGIAKAAAYIENHFKKLGLQPFAFHQYQLEYKLLQDSIMESYLTINGKRFEYNESFTGSNRNNKNQDLKATDLAYVGYGIEDEKYNDYKNIDVKNKIVVALEGEPMNADSTFIVTGTKKKSDWSTTNNNDKKHDAAKKNGAIAILYITKTYRKANKWPMPRGGQYPAFTINANSINKYYLNADVEKELWGDAKPAVGTVIAKPIEIHFAKQQFTTPSTNVIAVLPGTDKKDEYVFITAHMDHLGKKDSIIYYGADDDGSGTCAVLELAEAFAKAQKEGKSPRRSIVFMTVSGEERGLWGSEYYSENPVFPLAKTSVDLNIDMIGRVGSDYIKDAPDSLNYVYVIGDDKLSTDLRPINEEANNKYTKLKLDYRYNDPKDPNRFYYRSDHYNFAVKGVPIIFYFDGVHKDYHRPTDTPDKINYDMYSRRTQLVFYTAWAMANRDEMLKRDIELK